MFRTTLAVLVLLFAAGPASAQGVSLEFRDGYVDLSARNATVRQILAEWARQGQTRVVNADRVTGEPVTLELQGVPERRALETVLRNTSGYLASARPAGEPGASVFGRIMVMPPSTARAAGPAPPPQPVMAQPGMARPPFTPGVVDDQDQPVHGPPGFVPDQDDVQPEPPPDDGEGPQAPGFVPGMRGGVGPSAPVDPSAAAPPPPPGPTPLAPGAVVSPTPGVLPVPEP
jgi:hypothetical protein